MKNPHGVEPTRFMKRRESWGAIKCEPNCGPLFYGEDCSYQTISIGNNCNEENSCCIWNNGFREYDCHPQYKSSLYVNTNEYNKKDDENIIHFSVLDYEVFTPE